MQSQPTFALRSRRENRKSRRASEARANVDYSNRLRGAFTALAVDFVDVDEFIEWHGIYSVRCGSLGCKRRVAFSVVPVNRNRTGE